MMYIRTHTSTLGATFTSAKTGISVVRSQPARTKTLMTNLRSIQVHRAGIQHLPANGLSSPVRIATSSFYHSEQVPTQCIVTKDLLGIVFLCAPFHHCRHYQPPPPTPLPTPPPQLGTTILHYCTQSLGIILLSF